MTPTTGERIDHEDARLLAEWVNAGGHPWEYPLAGEPLTDWQVARRIAALLTDHSAREEVVRIAARISTQPHNHIRHDDLSDLQKAVAALPATESAQPACNGDRHVLVDGGKDCACGLIRSVVEAHKDDPASPFYCAEPSQPERSDDPLDWHGGDVARSEAHQRWEEEDAAQPEEER